MDRETARWASSPIREPPEALAGSLDSTVRRELLDRAVVLDERHLRRRRGSDRFYGPV